MSPEPSIPVRILGSTSNLINEYDLWRPFSPAYPLVMGVFFFCYNFTASFSLFTGLTRYEAGKTGKGVTMEERRIPCRECKKMLSAYLDRELSPLRVHELEAHLGVCRQCRAELVSLRGTLDTLSALRAPEPRQGLDALVMRRITEREQKPLHRLIPASLGMAALGLAIGVLLAGGLTPQVEPMIAENDYILLAMDVFSPSPKSSFSNVYFTMINALGR